MEIHGKRILVLGGSGLVGMAILRRLLEEEPEKVIVSSLRKDESKDALETLSAEFPHANLVPLWGNIFVRETQAPGRASRVFNFMDHPHSVFDLRQ